MTNSPAILKDPVLKHDEDYNYLREAGRQYIEELGSAIWTDYNEHDPGITILEALCYAITELGYRTSLPIKDLLAEKDGKIASSQTFFTAKQILTQSPLNKNDYRKLLIDIEGVQNAWLFTHSHYKDANGNITQAGEIAIYADKDNDELTFKPTIHPVYLRGFYKVLLDLEEDPQLGDLNNGEIDLQIIFSGQPVELTIIFPDWNEAEPDLFQINPGDVQPPFGAITVANDFSIQVSFTISANTYTLNGKVSVGLQPATGDLSTTDIQNLFTTNSIATQQLIQLYLSKIARASMIVQTAVRKLNKHRNLCEDFVDVETITDEEIAFCFDVDVIPSADIEQVEAYILFTIEEYLNPDVKFYLLSEMIQKINPSTGNVYTVDEIFEGPRLKHGFIDTTELESTELRKEIYASEIISRIMDIQINGEKAILAVRNFIMSAYNNDQVISNEANQLWCIKVDEWKKPVLSETKSKIVLYKNGIPFLAQEKETRQTLQWLESSDARAKLISVADDIPVPTGTYFPLETYTSIQSLFPQTYAVGNAALPPNASDERRAQAKQLKAYLLFYDQLLADFFMQLKNAKMLFSTDVIKQTYYAQFVNGFKDFDSIYAKDSSNNHLLTQNVLVNQDSSVALPMPENAWEDLYEPNETFVDRRNRFLDHLMARFAESFNEYVFMMYTLDNTTQVATRIDPTDLINNKREFLSNYPHMSYIRAKGFNYCPLDKGFNLLTQKLWNTDNVSGLEEKLCILGGFADPGNGIRSYYRRFLRCIGTDSINFSIEVAAGSSPVQYYFILTLDDLKLTSANYPSLTALNNDLIKLINDTSIVYDFIADPSDATKYIIQVTINGDLVITQTSSSFKYKKDVKDAIKKLKTEITISNCSNEGLHLIEHILLRPRNDTYDLAPVCLDDDCQSCSEDDPYSFRISVVLPYWVGHFNNMNFRTYFENIARQEAPAHCMLKVCWINQDAMLQFEICYCTWIQAMAAFYSNKNAANNTFLKDANNNMLSVLYSLHSEYPTGTLHNCDESKDTNPIMLGKTVLGTTK